MSLFYKEDKTKALPVDKVYELLLSNHIEVDSATVKVLYLSNRFKVKECIEFASGDPKPIFTKAFSSRIKLVIIATYTNGESAVSDEALLLCRRLKRLGNLVGVRLIDHVIINTVGYWSLYRIGVLQD